MKIKDKNRPDVEIIQEDNPTFIHNGVEHFMTTRIVKNYNDWLAEMYEQDAKVIYLHSMWHQLDLDKNNKVMKDYRAILHWVRFRIVERYDENGDTLLINYTPDPKIKAMTRVGWIKEEKN